MYMIFFFFFFSTHKLLKLQSVTVESGRLYKSGSRADRIPAVMARVFSRSKPVRIELDFDMEQREVELAAVKNALVGACVEDIFFTCQLSFNARTP